eukprot:scaffold5546_cov65-Phaeocystis_antarctica.AAC.5
MQKKIDRRERFEHEQLAALHVEDEEVDDEHAQLLQPRAKWAALHLQPAARLFDLGPGPRVGREVDPALLRADRHLQVERAWPVGALGHPIRPADLQERRGGAARAHPEQGAARLPVCEEGARQSGILAARGGARQRLLQPIVHLLHLQVWHPAQTVAGVVPHEIERLRMAQLIDRSHQRRRQVPRRAGSARVQLGAPAAGASRFSARPAGGTTALIESVRHRSWPDYVALLLLLNPAVPGMAVAGPQL